IEIAAEALPAREAVADRLCDRGTSGDALQLRFKPRLQLIDEQPRARLPLGPALVSGTAADLGFNSVEHADAIKCPRCDWRVSRLGDVVEAAAEVRPAQRQRHRATDAIVPGERVVGSVAVDLQYAGEAAEMAHGVLGAATWCVEVGNGGR